MPAIDELLGVATIATAGLIATIAIQPFPSASLAAAHGVRAALVVTGHSATLPNLQCQPGA